LDHRGQTFKVNVTLGRQFDEKRDEIRVVFETGNYRNEPLVSKGTSISIPVNKGLPKRKW
jgi:hypothetical protein